MSFSIGVKYFLHMVLKSLFELISNLKRAFNLKTNETNNWQNDFQLIGYWKSAQSIILAIIIAIIGRPINYCKPLMMTYTALDY